MAEQGGDRAKYHTAVRSQTGDRADRLAWEQGYVQPFVITMALDAHKLYGPEVDEACGTFEPAIDMWEAGQLYPTWDELNALADLTGNTVRFFVAQHELVPFGSTSLRFHLRKGEEMPPEPVACFTPAAILAATGTDRCPYCGLSTRPVVSLSEYRIRSGRGEVAPWVG